MTAHDKRRHYLICILGRLSELTDDPRTIDLLADLAAGLEFDGREPAKLARKILVAQKEQPKLNARDMFVCSCGAVYDISLRRPKAVEVG